WPARPFGDELHEDGPLELLRERELTAWRLVPGPPLRVAREDARRRPSVGELDPDRAAREELDAAGPWRDQNQPTSIPPSVAACERSAAPRGDPLEEARAARRISVADDERVDDRRIRVCCANRREELGRARGLTVDQRLRRPRERRILGAGEGRA